MKNLITILLVLLCSPSFSQSITLTDWDNNEIIEYVKTSNDGIKIEQGYLLSGKHHGKWVSYFDNGNVRVITHFVLGRKEGVWEYYSEEGLLTHEVAYEDNRRISVSKTRYFE